MPPLREAASGLGLLRGADRFVMPANVLPAQHSREACMGPWSRVPSLSSAVSWELHPVQLVSRPSPQYLCRVYQEGDSRS